MLTYNPMKSSIKLIKKMFFLIYHNKIMLNEETNLTLITKNNNLIQ